MIASNLHPSILHLYTQTTGRYVLSNVYDFSGFIQIAITVLANLMDCNSNEGEFTKRFFSIEEVYVYW